MYKWTCDTTLNKCDNCMDKVNDFIKNKKGFTNRRFTDDKYNVIICKKNNILSRIYFSKIF